MGERPASGIPRAGYGGVNRYAASNSGRPPEGFNPPQTAPCRWRAGSRCGRPWRGEPHVRLVGPAPADAALDHHVAVGIM